MRNFHPFALALVLGTLALAGLALAQEGPSGFWAPVIDQVLPVILAAVVTTFGGALTWAAARAAAFFTARAKAVENDLLRGVLTSVAHQAGIAVQHTSQTFVDRLKAASADGRLDPRDAQDVLRRAVYETWQSIGKQARTQLEAEHGGMAGALKIVEAAVEAKVHEAKVTTPVSEAPVTDEARAKAELTLLRERLRSLPSV